MRSIARFALLVALTACGSSKPRPTNPEPTASTPSSFRATVTGEGRAIIFIPGLACPATMWDGTIQRLAGSWQVHTLTLAGFAGEAPIAPPLLAKVRQELAEYIRTRKLDHPVVVGHSLGASMALWLAGTEPDLVGPVVLVDGTAYMPALEDRQMTPEKFAPQLKEMRAAMMGMPDFEGMLRHFMNGMVTDPAHMAPYLDAIARSDKEAVIGAMVELFSTDLREHLPKIKARALVVAAGKEAYAKHLVEQLQAIPGLETVILPDTKHFVMLDDPDDFARTVNSFLAGTAAH